MLLKRMVSLLCAAVIVGGVLAPNITLAGKPPRIVVSIKPVHALISGVTAGITKPAVLIPGGASPHAYSLRPSQARRLSRADFIFTVGNELETFLDKPLRSFGTNAKIVQLSKATGIEILKARPGGIWAAQHDHQKDHAHRDAHQRDAHQHDAHRHGQNDLHIWLSHKNAISIVRAAVKTFKQHDATNAERYKQNGDTMIARIEKQHHQLNRMLAPVKQVPFLVFHDAYQYFEKDFGLKAAGSIQSHQARKPGAKRLRTIHRTIRSLNIRCVFTEPQFKPSLAQAIVDGTAANIGILDPVGAKIPPGEDLYFSLLENLAKNLTDCLAKTS